MRRYAEGAGDLDNLKRPQLQELQINRREGQGLEVHALFKQGGPARRGARMHLIPAIAQARCGLRRYLARCLQNAARPPAVAEDTACVAFLSEGKPDRLGCQLDRAATLHTIKRWP